MKGIAPCRVRATLRRGSIADVRALTVTDARIAKSPITLKQSSYRKSETVSIKNPARAGAYFAGGAPRLYSPTDGAGEDVPRATLQGREKSVQLRPAPPSAIPAPSNTLLGRYFHDPRICLTPAGPANVAQPPLAGCYDRPLVQGASHAADRLPAPQLPGLQCTGLPGRSHAAHPRQARALGPLLRLVL